VYLRQRCEARLAAPPCAFQGMAWCSTPYLILPQRACQTTCSSLVDMQPSCMSVRLVDVCKVRRGGAWAESQRRATQHCVVSKDRGRRCGCCGRLPVLTEHPLPMIDVRERSAISAPRKRSLRAARQFGDEIDKRIDSSRSSLIRQIQRAHDGPCVVRSRLELGEQPGEGA